MNVQKISSTMTIGMTYGIPEIGKFGLTLRFWLSTYVTTIRTIPIAAIWAMTRDSGWCCRPSETLRRCCNISTVSTAMIDGEIQPAATLMLLLAMPLMTSWSMRTKPPSPISQRFTPCRARKNASVTTNDGMPSFATRPPMISPIAAPKTSAASTATNHFWSCSTSRTPMTAAAHRPQCRQTGRSRRAAARGRAPSRG